MTTAALDLSSVHPSGPLISTMNHLNISATTAPSDDGVDEMSSDETGSTFAHESSPATPRDGEMEELNGITPDARDLSNVEPISEEMMQIFRKEYNIHVMQRFGDGSSSKCFTQNAAQKVIKVMLGEEVDTKWVARSKERGLMLGNEIRPFTDDELKHASSSKVCLWKQLIGDDGNPILDPKGSIMVRKVALVEEFFDYINNLHFGEMKYVGEKSVFKRIREICACLPRQAINIYKKHCPHCQRSSRALSSKHRFNKKNKSKENEESSPFNGLSMVPMKRTYTTVDNDEVAKIRKLDEEPINPDKIKAAGIFIRSMVEDKLKPSRMFTDQAKEDIEYIIAAVGRQFPEIPAIDVRGRIRSHLKSIRRSSRKNGGCSERRRSLTSMCGSPAVLDLYNRALLSENTYTSRNEEEERLRKQETVSSNVNNMSKISLHIETQYMKPESNPEDEKADSPDLPTDLSVQKRPDEASNCQKASPSEAPVSSLQQTLAEVSSAGLADLCQNVGLPHHHQPTSQDYLNTSEYIRVEINQMYLTSLLLPMLMNHMHTWNSSMTPDELMQRWLNQVRTAANGVLNAVDNYEQYIRRVKSINKRS